MYKEAKEIIGTILVILVGSGVVFGLMFGGACLVDYCWDSITYEDRLELVDRCEQEIQPECSPGTVRDEGRYECQCDHKDTGEDVNWRIAWE
jgi:hypothetical protein